MLHGRNKIQISSFGYNFEDKDFYMIGALFWGSAGTLGHIIQRIIKRQFMPYHFLGIGGGFFQKVLFIDQIHWKG